MTVKYFIFIVAAISFTLSAGAQTNGIVSTAGANNIKGNVALSWIIGQPVASATTNAGKTVILTQGLQENMVVTSITENSCIPGKLSLYPNPAGDILNLRFEEAVQDDIAVALVDAKGNPVKNDRIEAATTEKQLDLKSLPSGIYYIRLTHGNVINVYKVVKL
jgi:hypothetical protein